MWRSPVRDQPQPPYTFYPDQNGRRGRAAADPHTYARIYATPLTADGQGGALSRLYSVRLTGEFRNDKRASGYPARPSPVQRFGSGWPFGGRYAWTDRVDLFGEASYATGLGNAGDASALSASAGLKVVF